MSTQETEQTKQTINTQMNPRQFVYPQGTKVEVEGYFISDLIMIFENLLKEEVSGVSKFKYKYINEKGNVVKTPKAGDVESGKVRKILDFEKTIIEPNIEYTISEKGIGYAELKNFLETIHFENIQKGIAVNYAELAQNQAVQPLQDEKKD